jgi:adenosyl cobinamide kinase/adenosyl cobinamide phosphate guanylyltransferase
MDDCVLGVAVISGLAGTNSPTRRGYGEVVVVSNEVGGGIVPNRPVGRRFRDLQGWANQILARTRVRIPQMRWRWSR